MRYDSQKRGDLQEEHTQYHATSMPRSAIIVRPASHLPSPRTSEMSLMHLHLILLIADVAAYMA
jgi:hypothetical protein